MIYEEKEFIVKDNLKVTVKSPEKEDAKELLEFINRICGQTDYLLSSPEDRKFSIEDEEKFIEAYKDNDSYLMVAKVDGKIIGDCSLNFFSHVKDKHRGNIGIAIDKEYWNKGIGSLLFDEMIKIAKEKGSIEQLELGVVDKNERAIALYLKKGFKITGKMPRALKLKDGTYFDEELMTLYL